MRVRSCSLVLLLIIATPASADGTRVYESFAGVEIGRVFLAPADRARLDERRLHEPVADAPAAAEKHEAGAKPRPRASAGYIISSSGRARVWHNGDFVESGRSPGSMKFPGDVRVIRKQIEPAPEAAAAQDREAPQGEAADDAD